MFFRHGPPHLRVWSIYDIDRPGAALAWDDALLPPPSWAVVDTDTMKGHLAYGLSVPVLVDSPDMRQKPLRYLCAVEAAFRAKLEGNDGAVARPTRLTARPCASASRRRPGSFRRGGRGVQSR